MEPPSIYLSVIIVLFLLSVGLSYLKFYVSYSHKNASVKDLLPVNASASISALKVLPDVAVVFTTSLVICELYETDYRLYLLEIAIISLLFILFVDFIPSGFAANKPLNTRNKRTKIIQIICKVLPVHKLISKAEDYDEEEEEKQVEYLAKAIDSAEADINEKKMLKAILESKSTEVKEILCARTDVTAVNITDTFDQVCCLVVECAYSRIPVYENNLDSIKGVLYIKDLLPYINNENIEWQKLVHEPYFVSEDKKINDLLNEFQSKKIHMAIVVDEYGGTAGIVTMEDILEEIVGDISDESDLEEEILCTKNKDGSYTFEGKILLNDFYRIMQLDYEIFEDLRGEAETLAGLILEFKGDFPKKGEEIIMNNYVFKINDADSRRIKQVNVKELTNE